MWDRLVFLLISQNFKENQTQLHILWNSKFARKIFYNEFNIKMLLKANCNLMRIEEKDINWKDTYIYYIKVLWGLISFF